MTDPLYLGLDIGTSSAKCLIADNTGRIIALGRVAYAMDSSGEGRAEQDPESWFKAAIEAVQQAVGLLGKDKRRIKGIGMTGQMHGLVMLDSEQKPLQAAIIWPDTRSAPQAARIMEVCGAGYIERTGGPSGTGLLLSSLLWIKDWQPWLYHSIRRVLLPKDYVRFRLTGVACTDPTDACGTGAYEPAAGRWAEDILEALQVNVELFPEIRASISRGGELLPEAADALGLPAGLPVVTGCGDLQASAVGAGVTSPDELLINVGTGGQVFRLVREYAPDPTGRTRVMKHADGANWHVMSAVLTAGLSTVWFAELVGGSDDNAVSRLFTKDAESYAAARGLFFLPYLVGEREPGRKTPACFVGLRMEHGRDVLFQAVLEGLVYSLYHCYGAFKPKDEAPRVIRAGGGGLRDARTRQMIADLFGLPVEYNKEPDTSALGAALVARSGAAGIPLAPAASATKRPGELNVPNQMAREVLIRGYAAYADLLRTVSDWQERFPR